MARSGDAPPANRYDGIGGGPRFAYLFETQSGLPVDGTSAHLRNLSPFTLRLLPPDALLAAASGVTLEGGTQVSAEADAASVSLIDAAALGASTVGEANTVASRLARVSGIGHLSASNVAALQSFVANGQFLRGTEGFVSTLADAFTAADISLQLSRILSVPPLTLLINPAEMTVQRAKLQNYQSRTRNGYSFEAWGEDQVAISFRGSTAGFVAAAVDVLNPYGAQASNQTSSPSGYQEAARRDSAAWQNFSSLYHFYRSNGYIYDTLGRSEAHLFIGAVAIDYDQWTYVGSIDSFGFTFDADVGHRVEFNMEFKAGRVYDRALTSSVVLPLSQGGGSLPGARPDLSGGRVTTSFSGDDEDLAQVPLDLLGGF